MSKVRIYELAKELNTTSKRLIEKLAEININVKNHMSYLEDHELKALYEHIGVITHEDEKKSEADEKKNIPAAPPKNDMNKNTKSAPRIIRKTEIIIDANDKQKQEMSSAKHDSGKIQQNEPGGDVRNERGGIVRKADSNSGLRPGFVRETKPDIKKSPAAVSASAGRDGEKKEAASQRKDTSKPLDNVSAPENKNENKGEHKKEMDAAKIIEQTQNVKEGKIEISETNASGSLQQPAVEKAKSLDKELNGEEIDKKEQLPAGEAKHQMENLNAKEQAKVNVQPAVDMSDGRIQKSNAKPDDKIQKQQGNIDGKDKSSEVTQENKLGQLQTVNHLNKDTQSNHVDQSRKAEQAHTSNSNKVSKFDNKSKQGQQGFGTGSGKHQGPGSLHKNKPSQDSGLGEKQVSGNKQQRNIQGGTGGFQGRNAAGDRATGKSSPKTLDIPKPELAFIPKEEISVNRLESKKEYQDKEAIIEKKENQKAQLMNKQKKERVQKVMLTGKKGISEVLSEDFIFDEFYDDDGRIRKSSKPKKAAKSQEQTSHTPPKPVVTSIKIPDIITVKELAEALKKASAEVIKKLMALGMMVTVNETIDFDTAAIIADEFGVKAEKEVEVNEEDILFDDSDDDEADLVTRPPVVVVMGHVDHGKTSLLDAIRNTNVTSTEAGGITQHIGAYMVKINNRYITFLDTPGHEAFTAMRARGAQVTDIAILVVAADDGVMPQTVEAINHAKAANVSIIVAINKIDKPGANPERVKQELTEYGLVPEEWGGDTICVNVSAKNGTNIDNLLEMVLLVADMLELKANPKKQAKGTVIEAKLDKGRGPVATVLVQRGTLRVGDSIITGTIIGRIRAMIDDKGNNVKTAGPSTPVEILGLPDVPDAGEVFYVITDEKVAKQLVEKRKLRQREQQLRTNMGKVTLDDLFSQIKEGKVKELNIIIKADVQGSVEAVRQSLEKLSNDEVRVNVIHGGVGTITESDVTLASVSNAIIIGFNVRPTANVLDAAKNAGVDIRLYRVIYNAIEDIQAAMKGMLEPTYKEVVLGHAEIRQIFKVSGVGSIGGCYVTDGKILRNSDIRVIRNGIVVYEGKLASLKRFKDDVREVMQGFECGLSIERFNDIKEGDVIEAYVMEEVQR